MGWAGGWGTRRTRWQVVGARQNAKQSFQEGSIHAAGALTKNGLNGLETRATSVVAGCGMSVRAYKNAPNPFHPVQNQNAAQNNQLGRRGIGVEKNVMFA